MGRERLAWKGGGHKLPRYHPSTTKRYVESIESSDHNERHGSPNPNPETDHVPRPFVPSEVNFPEFPLAKTPPDLKVVEAPAPLFPAAAAAACPSLPTTRSSLHNGYSPTETTPWGNHPGDEMLPKWTRKRRRYTRRRRHA